MADYTDTNRVLNHIMDQNDRYACLEKENERLQRSVHRHNEAFENTSEERYEWKQYACEVRKAYDKLRLQVNNALLVQKVSGGVSIINKDTKSTELATKAEILEKLQKLKKVYSKITLPEEPYHDKKVFAYTGSANGCGLAEVTISMNPPTATTTQSGVLVEEEY